MRQYPVPQFIERDSKITFFLSFKQLAWLLAGGVLLFFTYYIISGSLFYIAALLISAASLSLAFLKMDGVPLPSFIFSKAGFMVGKKKYTWEKKESYQPIKRVSEKEAGKMNKGESLKMGRGSQLKNKKTNIEF